MTATHATTHAATHDTSFADIRTRLRTLGRDGSTEEAAQRLWNAFGPDDWPELFRYVNLGAATPRESAPQLLGSLPPGDWPELQTILRDLETLHFLVDHPWIPASAEMLGVCRDPATATRQLEERHCTSVDFLLTPEDRGHLENLITTLEASRKGFWGQLEREEEPELFTLFDRALGSETFRQLTGFVLERDTYTLTLSLQDLQPSGIGWHRDLYWPKEWVGEDVFPVLYGLGSDGPEKGGAFLFYVPWENRLCALYRQHHEATILWNSRDPDGRLLHAVGGYHGEDTSRHLIILQCLRRQS